MSVFSGGDEIWRILSSGTDAIRLFPSSEIERPENVMPDMSSAFSIHEIRPTCRDHEVVKPPGVHEMLPITQPGGIIETTS